jgi:VWFA-related protein
MRNTALVCAMWFSLSSLPISARAQRPAVDTLHANSTLVLVPTRVITPSGDLVHSLQASDFDLTDNGIPQTVSVEEDLHDPLAVVVLLQIGGSAPRQYPNFKGLGTMLEYALGSSPYWVSLVTFDSKPEDRWPFSHNAANLRAAFEQPTTGDSGAAVLDAVEYGLDWFEDQHPRGRRILLLISDEHFPHPAEQARRVIRRLSETNTTVYSLNYSADATWLKDQFTKPRVPNPPYFFAPDRPLISGTFNLAAPLMAALGAMQANASAEIATLSGGVSLPFGNRKSLEQQMTVFANDLANRYLLSFVPKAASEGLHSIRVAVPQQPELKVTARSAYWRSSRPDGTAAR